MLKMSDLETVTILSQEFLIRLKLHDLPAYKIAKKAGVDSVRLSKLVNGITKVKTNDPDIIAVGKVLGLREDECFE